MDRTRAMKYVPPCSNKPALPDQYMRAVKDTNDYPCVNGVAGPIYDCNGNINYTLPLDRYPNWYQIHPEIRLAQKRMLPYAGAARYAPTVGSASGYYYGDAL